jgi:hypothetical protein
MQLRPGNLPCARHNKDGEQYHGAYRAAEMSVIDNASPPVSLRVVAQILISKNAKVTCGTLFKTVELF